MSEVASQSEDPRMKVYRDYFSRTNLGSRTEEIESQIGAEVTIYKPDPKSENPLRRHFYYTEVILPFLDSRIEVRIYAYGDLFHIPTEMQKRGEFPYSTRELLANIVVNELERLIRSVNVDHDQQTLEALETIRTAPKVDMIITHGFTYLPEGEIPLLPMLSVGIRTDVDPLDPMQDKNKMVYAANRWFMRSFPRFSRIIRRLFGEWKIRDAYGGLISANEMVDMHSLLPDGQRGDVLWFTACNPDAIRVKRGNVPIVSFLTMNRAPALHIGVLNRAAVIRPKKKNR